MWPARLAKINPDGEEVHVSLLQPHIYNTCTCLCKCKWSTNGLAKLTHMLLHICNTCANCANASDPQMALAKLTHRRLGPKDAQHIFSHKCTSGIHSTGFLILFFGFLGSEVEDVCSFNVSHIMNHNDVETKPPCSKFHTNALLTGLGLLTGTREDFAKVLWVSTVQVQGTI